MCIRDRCEAFRFLKEGIDRVRAYLLLESCFDVAEHESFDVRAVHGGSLLDSVGVFFEVGFDLFSAVEDVALAGADAVPVVVAGPAAQCVGAAAEKFTGFFRVEVWGVVHRGIPYAAVSSTWSNHAAM